MFFSIFPPIQMKIRFPNFLQKMLTKKPESLPSSRAQETFKFEQLDFQKKKDKKKLYSIYRRSAPIFHALNFRATLAIPSLEIKTTSDKQKKAVDLFLSALHPVSGNLALVKILRDLHVDTDWAGTGFWELILNEKKTNLAGIKKIHPIDIDLIREHGQGSKVKRDTYGNPVGWLQEVDNEKQELDFKEIAYCTFHSLGDEILGVSTLEPLYKTVYRLMNIEEGLATSIFRHGFPLYDITVGTEERMPTKEQIDDAIKEVKGLNFKSEFVHPPNYKVALLEAYSLGKGHDYTGVFIESISAATDIPRFLLMGTAKDLSRASAQELRKMLAALKHNQDCIKLFFEEQVLKPLMEINHIDEVPELILGDIPFVEKAGEDTKDTKDTKDIKDTEEKKKDLIFIKPGSYSQEELNKEIDRQLEDLTKPEKLPGLYIVQPHTNLIYEGDKKSIVKSPAGMKMLRSYVGKEMYLVSENKVFGIIKLREPREINVNEFLQLRYAHKVSDDERKEWWPKEEKLWIYEFEIIKLYHPVKKFKVPKGVQVIVKDVVPK